MKQKKIFALGFFDGVHLGHQALLSACVRLANRENATAAAVTFDLPPSTALGLQQPNMINSVRDRQALLRQYGMEQILVLPATKEVMSTDWQDFLSSLLVDGAVGFVCGEDYRFGKNGQGTAQMLAAYAQARNLPCIIVPEQTMDGQKISSTRIRSLLEKGDVENANRLLGHPHILTGTVVSGQKLGRTIGIPTANLRPEDSLIIPPKGVYATRCQIGDENYAAVTNIGTRPTVSGQGVTIEPWILDFDGDLYGREITLSFHKFLRPEQKFPNLEELKAEILKNAAEVRKIFEI